MSTQEWTTHSDAETRDLGRRLSAKVRPGDLMTLSGPLGAGKTTLVQGLAQGLEVATDATSPTFVLIIEHAGRIPLLHLDAYRLETKCFDAIRDAGVPDFLDRDDAVKVVEWPERIFDFLPRPRFAVTIEAVGDTDERSIQVVEDE